MYMGSEIVSPIVPVSPKDFQDSRVKVSPIVPSPIQGTRDKLLGLNLEQRENKGNPTPPPLDVLRRLVLETFRKKQPFRVAVGKSKWVQYETFSPNYNLRERLNDEVIIEFDTSDQNIVVPAINFTGINLYNAGIKFEWWEHGGKSPHLHIHDLPIAHLDNEQRKQFKKIFIRKYVPLEFLKWVDISLTNVGLIRLEWSPCFKGKYGIKKLISVFDGANKQSWGAN